MKKILKNLDAIIAGGLFAITLVIVVVNVFSRYLFNYIFAWSEEVATSCFVYTTFIGAAWCLRTRQHVGVDLLVNKLPPLGIKIMRLITDFIILLVNGYITRLSYIFVIKAKTKTMPILKISSVYLNSALIIGFGLMTVYSLWHCYEDMKAICKKEDIQA